MRCWLVFCLPPGGNCEISEKECDTWKEEISRCLFQPEDQPVPMAVSCITSSIILHSTVLNVSSLTTDCQEKACVELLKEK